MINRITLLSRYFLFHKFKISSFFSLFMPFYQQLTSHFLSSPVNVNNVIMNNVDSIITLLTIKKLITHRIVDFQFANWRCSWISTTGWKMKEKNAPLHKVINVLNSGYPEQSRFNSIDATTSMNPENQHYAVLFVLQWNGQETLVIYRNNSEHCKKKKSLSASHYSN